MDKKRKDAPFSIEIHQNVDMFEFRILSQQNKTNKQFIHFVFLSFSNASTFRKIRERREKKSQ